MSLRINDVAPNFTTDSTAGKLTLHDWMGDSYAILFSHHIPSLMKGAGFFGDRQFFDISSVSNFFNSYFGKILFFFITYFTLHYYVFTTIRKIKLPKVYKNKDIINNNATSKNNNTVK